MPLAPAAQPWIEARTVGWRVRCARQAIAHPVSWWERTARLAALETLPRFADIPHALPGNPLDACFISLQKPWQHARALAAGNSLSFVGKSLGHGRSTTTERYSRFAPDSTDAVADRIAERLSATLIANRSTANGDVIEHTSKRMVCFRHP
jgi:hypothetical protein